MTGDEAKAIVDHWGCRARNSQKAHYLVATKYSRYQAYVTIGLVVLTAFTGSALFATLSNQNSNFQLALAILSVASAALAGFDRSQRFLENAEKHRQAGAAWTNVVQQTELLWEQLPTNPPQDLDSRIAAIGKQMDEVTAKSPQIPERVFRKCQIGQTYVFP